jgi:hypothetical protein
MLACKQAYEVSLVILTTRPPSIANTIQQVSQAAARRLKLFFENYTTKFEQGTNHAIKLHNPVALQNGWKTLQPIILLVEIGYLAKNLADYDSDESFVSPSLSIDRYNSKRLAAFLASEPF